MLRIGSENFVLLGGTCFRTSQIFHACNPGEDVRKHVPPKACFFRFSSRRPQGGGYSGKSVCHEVKSRYLPRPMPKAIARSKTRKSVSKRFKITGTGKVMRQHASRRHLLSSKSAKRKRHMAKSAEVDKTDTYRIKSNMPFA